MDIDLMLNHFLLSGLKIAIQCVFLTYFTTSQYLPHVIHILLTNAAP